MAQSSGDLQTSVVIPHHGHHRLPEMGQQIGMYIGCPKEMDVVYGRGGLSNNHEGNKVFRELIMEKKEEYEKTSGRTGKNKIAKEIVNEMRKKGSRFLLYSEEAQMWFDSGDTKAVEKTKQRFRELRDKRIQSRKANEVTRREKQAKGKEPTEEHVLDSEGPKEVVMVTGGSHPKTSTKERSQHKDLMPRNYPLLEGSPPSRLKSAADGPLPPPALAKSQDCKQVLGRTFNEEIPHSRTEILKRQDARLQMQNLLTARVKEDHRLSRESDTPESMQDRLARLYSFNTGKHVSPTDNYDTLDRSLGQMTAASNTSKYAEFQAEYIGSGLDPYPTLRSETLCSRDISRPRIEGLPPRNNSYTRTAPTNAANQQQPMAEAPITRSAVLSGDELWPTRASRQGHTTMMTVPSNEELMVNYRLEALRQSHDALSRMRERRAPEQQQEQQPCAVAPLSTSTMEDGIERRMLCSAMADVAVCSYGTRRRQTSCASSMDMSLFSDLSEQCPEIDKVEHRLSHIPIQDLEMETDESRRVLSSSPKQPSSLPQAGVVVETVNVVFAENELGRERSTAAGGMSLSDNDSARSVLTMSDIGNSDHLCDEGGSQPEGGRRMHYERSDSVRSIMSEFDNLSYLDEATVM